MQRSNRPLPRTEMFLGSSPQLANNTTNGWIAWARPVDASKLTLICIGAGAGGGGGLSGGAPLTRREGGAGGGSGAISRLTIAAKLLPSILYLFAGQGGLGGVAGVGTGGTGIIGGRSCIADTPGLFDVTASTILVSGVAESSAGAPGTNTGTTGGPAGSIMTATQSAYASYGAWTAIAGQAGGDGSGGVGDQPLAWGGRGIPISGGAGGGGISAGNTPRSGGIISGAGLMPGSTAPAADSGGDGEQGIVLLNPWRARGGGGGASSSAGTSGSGANGAPGCGGGGGGSGLIGGAGGNGGPGMIVIVSW